MLLAALVPMALTTVKGSKGCGPKVTELKQPVTRVTLGNVLRLSPSPNPGWLIL